MKKNYYFVYETGIDENPAIQMEGEVWYPTLNMAKVHLKHKQSLDKDIGFAIAKFTIEAPVGKVKCNE